MSRRDRPEASGVDLHADLLADAVDAEVAPRAELREALIASLDPATKLAGFVPRLAAFFDLPPERAREILDAHTRVAADPWVDDQVAGVRLLHFEGGARVAEADCGLVHVGAGHCYPQHRHRGDEWAFVLSGTAREEDTGRIWYPGDVLRNPAGSSHTFTVLGDEPFLFAVVLYDGIELETDA